MLGQVAGPVPRANAVDRLTNVYPPVLFFFARCACQAAWAPLDVLSAPRHFAETRARSRPRAGKARPRQSARQRLLTKGPLAGRGESRNRYRSHGGKDEKPTCTTNKNEGKKAMAKLTAQVNKPKHS